MPWEPLDHTADVGVLVSAGDREMLFAEALRALTDCITDVERVRPRTSRAVDLVAADLELLLVEWLGEALYRFDAEGFLASEAEVEILDRGDRGLRLAGEMRGEPHDPERHPHRVAVKAVTYHRLEVARTAAGWTARLIFDI